MNATATVTPGYIFDVAINEPISLTKLNALGQPTVTLPAGIAALGNAALTASVAAGTAGFAATQLVLVSSGGAAVTANAVSVTGVTLTAAGAGGLDAGSATTATWYYLWAISSGSGAVAGLLSLSNTAPALPAGYGYACLIGPCYSTSTTALRAQTQIGRQVWFAILQAGSVLATTYASLSLAAIAPPMATMAHGIASFSTGTAVSYAISADGTNPVQYVSGTATEIDTAYAVGSWSCPLFTAQTLYGKCSSATDGALNVNSYNF